MPQLEYHLTRLERTCIPDHNPAIMVQCCNGYHVKTFKLFSPADIHFWISDDVITNGLWAPQRGINIHIVFAALTF